MLPVCDRVGETEWHAAQDGRPTVGAHQQQSLAARERLQLDLVLDRDVVAEQKDVQSALEGFERLGGGEGARRRDQRQVGVGHFVQRFGERVRRLALPIGVGQAARPRPDNSERACAWASSTAPGLARNGDDQVVRPGGQGIAGQQTGRRQHLAVGRTSR